MKKILALVLALAMVLSLGALAGFNDVKDTDANLADYQLLSGLGIIDGYADGSFRPDGIVTRAEAAAFIYRMATGENKADFLKGPVSYNGKKVVDIRGDEWFTGYINWAVEQGVMAGYPDGTFRPDSIVTVAEMSKMLVVALGYPANNYTFPYGFMTQAKNLGVLTNVDAGSGPDTPCKRSMISKMTVNALTAPRISFITGPNGSSIIAPSTPNFLVASFNAKESGVMIIQGTSSLGAVSPITKEKQIKFEGLNLAFDYAGSADDLIGRPLTVLFKGASAQGTTSLTANDKILAVVPRSGYKVAYVNAGDIAADGSFKLDGVTYQAPANAASAATALSGAAATWNTVKNTQTNTTFKVIINNNVSPATSAALSLTPLVQQIEAINEKTGEVKFKAVGADNALGAKAKEVLKLYDGAAKGDFVYVSEIQSIYTNASKVTALGTTYSVVKANTVSNVKATALSTAGVYTIGGTDYKLSAGISANDTPKLGNSHDLILSPTGAVKAATTVGIATTEIMGIVTNFGATAANSGLLATYKDHTITIQTADGKEVTYPVANGTYGSYLTKDKAWTPSSSAGNFPNIAYQPVVLTLKSDGTVSSIVPAQTVDQVADGTHSGVAGALAAKLVIASNGIVTTVKADGTSVVNSWTAGDASSLFYVKNGGDMGTIKDTQKVEVSAYKGSALPQTTALTLTHFKGTDSGARSLRYAVVTDAPTGASVAKTGYIQYLGQKLNGDDTLHAYRVTYQGSVLELVSPASKAAITTSATPLYGTLTVSGNELTAFSASPLAANRTEETVAALTGTTLVIGNEIHVLDSNAKVFILNVKGTAGNYTYESIGAAAALSDITADSIIDFALENNKVTELYLYRDVD